MGGEMIMTAHWALYYLSHYSLHHSFYIFWESLQNVSLKTLEGTYSEEMGLGFQIMSATVYHLLNFSLSLFFFP